MPAITLEQIDTVLPQSQCQQCGYPSCMDYANAMLHHQETVDKCLFGGTAVTVQLAKILAYPLASCKEFTASQPVVALIDESSCIGCLKCIQICPVDTIIGAKRQLHTVIEADCTGCKLCLDACPMDCISLEARTSPPFSAAQARQLYLAKKQRTLQAKEPAPPIATVDASANRIQHKQSVADAIARAKLKKAQKSSSTQ